MKVEELVGAQLDYWVAMAGEEWKHFDVSDTMTLDPSLKGVKLVTLSGGQQVAMLQPNNPFRQEAREFSPSTDWAHGGPIIEREVIDLSFSPEYGYVIASIFVHGPGPADVELAGQAEGHSPLVAAMRAFVISKFGESVSDEVPA